jgi:hypothetical protein
MMFTILDGPELPLRLSLRKETHREVRARKQRPKSNTPRIPPARDLLNLIITAFFNIGFELRFSFDVA